MYKIKKSCLIFLFLTLLLLTTSACSREDEYMHQKEGYTSVVKFELLEGKYKDLDTYIKFAYKPNSYVIDPNILTHNKIIRPNYSIEGWYRNYQSESKTFSDKWDFKTDKILDENITLYPNWIINYQFTFSLVMIEDNQEVLLHQYRVNPEAEFKDSLNKAKRSEYTLLGFYSDYACSIPWDTNFKHPGGTADKDIKVYAKYLKGEFKLVRTKSELKVALAGNYNIYLLNDIDFEGDELSVLRVYTSIFEGNNFTIKNLRIKNTDLKGNVYVGIFSELENAVLQNIHFKNIQIQIKTGNTASRVNIGLLSGKAVNSVFSNISFQGSLTLEKDQKASEIQYNYLNLIYEDLNNTQIDPIRIDCTFLDLREE